MEFYIEKHSSSSVVTQIQEQIRVAVAMGVFRRGDTLPSIRDVEKQTGINRGLVHKAYLELRKSGLLTLARGKGTVISTEAPPPPPATEKCRELSIAVIRKARQAGLSPTAFARYLSRHAQEDERQTPFIAYVDREKDDAMKSAEHISELWKVPILGLAIQELKNRTRNGFELQKVLANYFVRDRVQSLFPGKGIDVIPIAMRASEQDAKALARIKANSSVLLIIPSEVYAHASFIAAHFPKLIASRGIRISHISTHAISNIEDLLNDSRYNLLLVGPGAQGKVPHALRTDPRLLFLHMEMDPASLEAARVRAGVIV